MHKWTRRIYLRRPLNIANYLKWAKAGIADEMKLVRQNNQLVSTALRL